ncbi:MAG: hypothetical protein JW844_01765 [Candidatus Omnitrophica bacterium]|nr:hypothetical protein [Candidatus Omnitrophota bacterium]
MKRISVTIVIISLFFVAPLILPASASEDNVPRWRRIDSGFLDGVVTRVHCEDHIIFAWGGRYLYRIDTSTGQTAEMLFDRDATRVIFFISSFRALPGQIFLGTDRGLFRSMDSGAIWEHLPSWGETPITCLKADPNNDSRFFASSYDTLYETKQFPGQWIKKYTLSDIGTISSFSLAPHKHECFYLETTQGLFAISGSGKERLIGTNSPETAEAQSEIDEPLFSAPALPRLTSYSNNFIYVDGAALFFSDNLGLSWNRFSVQGLNSQKIRQIMVVGNRLVALAENGIFLFMADENIWRSIAFNLSMSHVLSIASDNSDCPALVAVTERGIFQLDHIAAVRPPASMNIDACHTNPNQTSHDPNEPSIQEVHRMVIAYADLEPEKIRQWRRRSVGCAFLPELSLGYDYDSTMNIDLDRGGTSDPDVYIVGPKEKNAEWSVSLGWDLSKLLWNDDILTIELRAKTLADLREEILNRATHLYFERKRLQHRLRHGVIEEGVSDEDIRIQIEEVTGYLDSLTGGGFSRYPETAIQ